MRTRIYAFITAILFVFASIIGQAYATSINDQQRYGLDAPYYWPGLACADTGGPIPPGTLPKIIPEPYNGAFTQGGNNSKVAPALVAAIFTEENMTHSETSQLASNWALFLKGQYGGALHRPPGPQGVNSGWPTSSAGATGPFQFLPSTWAIYGKGGNINNLADGAKAAAALLAAGGATTDKPPSSWQNAILSYNHAQWYVDAVMTYYNFYISGKTSSTPPAASAAVSNPCGGGTSSVACKGAKPAGTSSLSATRQAAVCVAENELSLWKSNKMFPGFRNCNDISASSNCTSFAKYSQNNNEFWCADFVSWVYHTAGYPILSGSTWRTASVEDIYDIGHSGGRWHWHAAAGYTPKPGDLEIHYDPSQDPPFAHVNMVVPGTGKSGWAVIGGDQGNGPYPDGSVVSGYPVPNLSADPPTIIGFVTPD